MNDKYLTIKQLKTRNFNIKDEEKLLRASTQVLQAIDYYSIDSKNKSGYQIYVDFTPKITDSIKGIKIEDIFKIKIYQNFFATLTQSLFLDSNKIK